MSKHFPAIPTETVTTPGGPLVLRGIGLADIMPIFAQHREKLSEMFAAYTAGAMPVDDPAALAASLMSEAPDIVARAIVAAADGDEDDISTARRLPLPVQVEAIMAIFRLTMTTEGGVKNFVETVIRAMQGATESLTSLQA